MVKKYLKNIRRFAGIMLILVFLIKITGCEPEDFSLNDNCNDCLSYWPDSSDLIILLTINDENPSVPIQVYRGTMEANELDWTDTATVERYKLYSAIDQVYTVKATYKSGIKTIFAYDSDHMYNYDSSEECREGCILVKGGVLDLRLKE